MKSKTIVWLFVVCSAVALAGTGLHKAWAGTKWEYKRIEVHLSVNYGMPDFNKAGDDGWEYIGPVPSEKLGGDWGEFLFRRQHE